MQSSSSSSSLSSAPIGPHWDDLISPEAWDELQALQLGDIKSTHSEEQVIQMLGVGTQFENSHLKALANQNQNLSMSLLGAEGGLTSGGFSSEVPNSSPLTQMSSLASPTPSSPASSSSPYPVLPLSSLDGQEEEFGATWEVKAEPRVSPGMFGGPEDFNHQFPRYAQQAGDVNFKFEATYMNDSERGDDGFSPDSGMDASNDDDSEGTPSSARQPKFYPASTAAAATTTATTTAMSTPASVSPKQGTPRAPSSSKQASASKSKSAQKQQQQQQQQQQQVVPQIPQGVRHPVANQGGLSASVHSALGNLIEIASQPAKFARFRYKNEKRSHYLEGECGPIEVTLRPDVATRGRNITVKVAVVTSIGAPHWHELGGNLLQKISERDPNNRIQFPDLHVVMESKKNKEHDKDENRAVKLKFTLTFDWIDGKPRVAEVVSRSILNTTLEITHLSHTSGPAAGGNQLFILGQKFDNRHTAVVIEGPPIQKSSSALGWTNTVQLETNASLAKIILPASSLEFHHQYAVIATLPPFYLQDIREPVTVSIQIINSNDDTSSNTRQYVYVPNEQIFRNEATERKRQRMDEDARRFFGPGGNMPFGGNGGNNNGGGSGSGGNIPPSQHSPNPGFGGGGSMSGYQGGGYLSHSASGPGLEMEKLCVKFFSALGDPKYILAAMREATQQTDENGDTPLHHAIANNNESIALGLIEIATPQILNGKNVDGDAPLHLATWGGNLPILEKLLSAGARPDAPDHKGRTAFHIACEKDSADSLNALLAGSTGTSALLSIKAYSGQTVIQQASQTNKTNMVAALVNHGAPLSEGDTTSGATPLMNAAKNANTPMIDVMSKSKSWKRELLSQKDFRGNTALHYAVATNVKEVVKLLMELGADPEIANCEGKDCHSIAEKRGLVGLKDILQNQEGKKKRVVAPPPYSNEEADWELVDPMDVFEPDPASRAARARAFTQLTSLFNEKSHQAGDRKRSSSVMPKSGKHNTSTAKLPIHDLPSPVREKSPIPATSKPGTKQKDTVSHRHLSF